MVRLGSLLPSLNIFASITALVLTCACTKKETIANVKVVFPANSISRSVAASAVSSQSFSEDSWGLSDPTDISQFDCYAVVAGAQEPGMDQNVCYDTTNSSELVRFGPLSGLFGKSTSTTMSVPSGAKRTLYVIGYDLADGASCEKIDDLSAITQAYYSAPFILGKTTVDLPPGDASVTIHAAFDSTMKVGNCISNSPPPQTNVPLMFLGSGVDGSQNYVSSQDLSTVSNSYGTTIMKSAPVNAVIDNADGSVEIEVPGAITTANFKVGDELIFYVNAEGTSGCGGALGPAQRRNGIITVAPYPFTSVTRMRVVFADYPSMSQMALVAPAIYQAVPTAGSTFCNASVTRVANFQDLIIPGAGGYLMAPQYLNGAGGIMFIRVRGELKIGAAGGTGSIRMIGSGYRGGPTGGSNGAPGMSYTGQILTPSSSSNASGGGGGFGTGAKAGGGANAGQGLNGWDGTSAYLAGVLYNTIAITPLNLLNRMFMGGGGGGIGAPGGNGGGLIVIVANKINVESTKTLQILADGASVTSITGGAGAGGSILVRTHNLIVENSGTLKLSAKGGSTPTGGTGVSSDAWYGAGGGGVVQVDLGLNCQVVGGTILANVSGGISAPVAPVPQQRQAAPGALLKNGPSDSCLPY